MKRLSASVLWLQAVLFALATVYLIWAFIKVLAAGAGFVPGFESVMLRRLIAFLAPYLVLPISIMFSLFLHNSGKYAAAVGFPLALVALAIIAGQIYRTVVPDPIIDNFGARAAPYPGFLVLFPDAVPAGFQETAHHYTKQEYAIHFTKMLNGERVDLDIVESPTTQFVLGQSKLVRQFTYQGMPGHVYASYNDKTEKTTINLIWLNPPRQRISIYLTQTRGNDYSPEDVIKVLERMKSIEQQR